MINLTIHHLVCKVSENCPKWLFQSACFVQLTENPKCIIYDALTQQKSNNQLWEPESINILHKWFTRLSMWGRVVLCANHMSEYLRKWHQYRAQLIWWCHVLSTIRRSVKFFITDNMCSSVRSIQFESAEKVSLYKHQYWHKHQYWLNAVCINTSTDWTLCLLYNLFLIHL